MTKKKMGLDDVEIAGIPSGADNDTPAPPPPLPPKSWDEMSVDELQAECVAIGEHLAGTPGDSLAMAALRNAERLLRRKRRAAGLSVTDGWRRPWDKAAAKSVRVLAFIDEIR